MVRNHERERQAFLLLVGELLQMGYSIRDFNVTTHRATFRSGRGDFTVKPLDKVWGTLVLEGKNINPQAPKNANDTLILPSDGAYAIQARTLLAQTKPPTGSDVLSNLVHYILMYGSKTSTTIDVTNLPSDKSEVYIMAYGAIHKFVIHNPTSKGSTPLTNARTTVHLSTPQEIVTWAVSQ